MEVLTCYCNQDLCNDNNLLRGKLSEWTATTMARLKAGPTHILDILISVATGCVVVFFLAVILINIPWRKLFPRQEVIVENGDECEEEVVENIDETGEGDGDNDAATSGKREKED